MTWPTSIIIDTVFIPIYIVLAGLAFLNCTKHGRQRSVGFISLLIFAVVRVVGNILIVVEYNNHYTSITTTVWGYILQSIGYSFLYSSSLAFYLRAEQSTTDHDSVLLAKLPRFLHLANLAALVLVIVGQSSVKYTNADGAFITPHLPIEAKIGVIIYIVITLILLALVLFAMRNTLDVEARVLLITLAIGLPLMLIRVGYSTFASFTNSTLMPKNIWVKLVLQYITELAVMVLYTLLGLRISKLEPPYETPINVEDGQASPFVTVTSPTRGPQPATPDYGKAIYEPYLQSKAYN